MYSIPNGRGFKCKDNDKQYCVHYGQYTEIQTIQEQMDDLTKHFVVLYVGQRLHDQSITFHCVAKPETFPSTAQNTPVDMDKKS
jgi:hypothetical protein